jgi:hypothetical protein
MAARAPEEFVADTIVRLSIEPVQRVVLRAPLVFSNSSGARSSLIHRSMT